MNVKNSLLIALLITWTAGAQTPPGAVPLEGEQGSDTAAAVYEGASPSEDAAGVITPEAGNPETTSPSGIVDEQPPAEDPVPAQSEIAPVTPGSFLDDVGDQMELRGALPANQTADTDQRERTDNPIIALLKMIVSLSFVIALILIIFYFVRKVGKRTSLLAGPELGTVLGRIHLGRGSALHFVRAGGRILVVGVTNNAMSLIAEFDGDAFSLPAEEPAASGEFNPDQFLEQLRNSSEAMNEIPTKHVKDDEIDSLRSDIQRLQEYLREESRDSGE